jgi:LAO/AO transport system kinase
MSNGKWKSALHVNDGVEQPENVNDRAIERIRKKRKQFAVEYYLEGIQNKDLSILSQAITLIESTQESHQKKAQAIIEKCLPSSGKSIRIGITGVPGVGKSTFIEAFGNKLIQEGRKVAVLAVDPSSERSKGSILGDKTRMEKLANSENAFIRPSPSAGSLGGVARKTRETIILCEAAGFDTILIETVGVGQSETLVKSMVDFFLLLMLAGAGDELQGIKRGIMEMADAIAITKTDGDNINNAISARSQYENAIHLFPKAESGVNPQVFTCSSISGNGIERIWEFIRDHQKETQRNGYFESNRSFQSKYWMHETILETLKLSFYGNKELAKKIEELEKLVTENKMSSYSAAGNLLEQFNQLKH